MGSMINIQPSEQAWDYHRPELERLYVDENKSVQYIKQYMEEKYNFRASKYQFDKHFSRKWKCGKYGSSLVWKAVLPYVRKLEQEGKGAAVFIDMKRKSSQEVRNAMARYKGYLSDLSSAGMPILPENAIVQPVVQPITVLISHRLPFYFMERQLVLNLPPPPAGHHSTATTAASKEMLRNPPLERILSVAVPPEQHQPAAFNLPIMSTVTRLFASPLHRALLYSITNNLVGFDAIPPQEILNFLKQETTYSFFLALSSAPDLYTVQALTRSIFWLALNAGDAEAVPFILRHSPGMDVNGNIPGRQNFLGPVILYVEKPIEVASALGHVEVVRALIAAGAQVDGTSAFEKLVDYESKFTSTSRVPEVLKLLLNASSDLSMNQLAYIIRHNDSSVTHELIMKHIRNSYHNWIEDGVFLSILQLQRVHTCYEALKTLRECGVDLNVPLRVHGSPYYIVDVLAERLKAETLCRLLDSFPQFHLTEMAVTRIISDTGDMSLVKYALIHGPGDYAKSEYRDHLINYAVAEDLIQPYTFPKLKTVSSITQRISRGMVVLEYLASRPTGDIQDLKESFIMAALVGDAERIKKLLAEALTSYGKRCSELLYKYDNWLICRTLEAGHPETALSIVEAGVVIRHGARCLKEALRIKHVTLFRALMDAINITSLKSTECDLLSFAIENDGYEYIRDLLENGMDPNDGFPAPLWVAFSYKSLEVAKLLFDYGAIVNGKNSDGETALQVATKTSDPAIVQFALDHGADPHDPRAINMAAERGSCLFNLIMGEHKRRYNNNKGYRGWGMVFTHMADVHASHRTVSDLTSFGHAVRFSKETGLGFLELLLGNKDKLKCFPNTKVSSNRRMTAFLVAVEAGHLPTIKLFLKHGADPGFAPRGVAHGRTPLQLAVENGDLEVVKLLLDHGASVKDPIAYSGGATALQLAAIQGYIPIMQLLLERGAEVDAPPAKIFGETALEGAAHNGRLDTVAFLLSAGAANKGKDKHQLNRAIQLAQGNSHVVVEQLLRDFVETGELQTSMGFFSDFVDLDAC
ncbi:hypothetical protein PG989_007677 [Apiospora arundinis]